jgi:hypothetical protein
MADAEQTATKQRRIIGRPFKPGQSGNPNGRPPSKAGRISAVMEGLRRRFDKATAEEAISAAVQSAEPEDVRHYVAMVMPKQEDPDLPAESRVRLRMVGSATEDLPAQPPAENGNGGAK